MAEVPLEGTLPRHFWLETFPLITAGINATNPVSRIAKGHSDPS